MVDINSHWQKTKPFTDIRICWFFSINWLHFIQFYQTINRNKLVMYKHVNLLLCNQWPINSLIASGIYQFIANCVALFVVHFIVFLLYPDLWKKILHNCVPRVAPIDVGARQ